MNKNVQTIKFKGETLPVIGFGTWCVGDDETKINQEIECIRTAVDSFGITLIDTAEMYGNGKAENVVGKAIETISRDKLFIVDKILPENAVAGKYRESIMKSLELVKCDYFDLYLLHWRENVNLQSMVDEMEELIKEGLIRHWGVSNFDVDDMEELFKCNNGDHCFANQVLYNISERGIEYDLIPWCKEHNVLIMAYSTLGNVKENREKIIDNNEIKELCKRNNVPLTNLMLRFVTRDNDLIALFKTSSVEHLSEDMLEVSRGVTEEEMQVIDKYYKAPTSKVPLGKI